MAAIKPRVQLSGGFDGNAFMVIGRCRNAAKKAGWSKEKIDAVVAEMKDGNYDHLLQVIDKYFDAV